MANLGSLLASLFGAQGASELPPLPQQGVPGLTPGMTPGFNPAAEAPYDPANDIVAIAPNMKADTPTYNIRESENPMVQVQQQGGDTSILPRTQASPQDQARQAPMQGLLPHKGMFGMKGTLRDILGLLGDSMLIGTGGKAMYQPQKQQERYADTLTGYGQGDEVQDRAAIGRAIYEQPELGTALADKYAGNRVAQQNADSTAAKNSSERLAKGRDYAARLLANVKTPEDMQFATQLIQRTTGLTPDQLGLSQEMTPEQRAIYSRGDMSVNQQVTTDLRRNQQQMTNEDRDLAREQRDKLFDKAEAGRMARDNPPPTPSRPRADTPLEYYREIDNKPESKRTPGEKAFYKKYQSTGKKSSTLEQMRDGQSAPAPKFKPGQTIYKNGKAYVVNKDGKTATPK